jgi:hypothetical protein
MKQERVSRLLPSAALISLVGLWLLDAPRVDAQAPGSSVRLLAVGDTGDDKGSADVVKALEAQVRAHRTDAVVFLGDNFYPAGLNGKDWQGLLERVMNPFRNVVDAVGSNNVHAVTGNHDYYQ